MRGRTSERSSRWHKILEAMGFGRREGRRSVPPLKRHSLLFEPLEDRHLLSVLYWDPQHTHTASAGGQGTWTNGGSADWYNGQADVAWNNANGDTAVFQGTAATVAVNSAVTAVPWNTAVSPLALFHATSAWPLYQSAVCRRWSKCPDHPRLQYGCAARNTNRAARASADPPAARIAASDASAAETLCRPSRRPNPMASSILCQRDNRSDVRPRIKEPPHFRIVMAARL